MSYFPKELIELTRVTVGKGQFVFAGDYTLKTPSDVRFGDPLQSHYLKVLRHEIARKHQANQRMGVGTFKIERDPETEAEFLEDAKKDLADSGWAALIK